MCAGDGHRAVFPGEAVKAETRKSSKSQGEEGGGVSCVKASSGAGRTQRKGS